MKRKILVAVDDSVHCARALRYVSQLLLRLPDLHLKLIHIQPQVSSFLLEEAEKTLAVRAEVNQLMERHRTAAQTVLDRSRNRLVSAGVSDSRIETLTQPQIQGLAKDILDHAQQSLCDALLVGRRGLSALQEMFMGSLTAKIVEHCGFIPLWIVDGDALPGRTMIAVDGSESALRAVDHAAFMLGGASDTRLTLFHVRPSLGEFCSIDVENPSDSFRRTLLQSDRRCMDDFMDRARQTFAAAGISWDRIDLRISRSRMGTGRAIVAEAKKGGYQTVVLGRRGMRRAFFMGRVSQYVLNKSGNRALWVVP